MFVVMKRSRNICQLATEYGHTSPSSSQTSHGTFILCLLSVLILSFVVVVVIFASFTLFARLVSI